MNVHKLAWLGTRTSNHREMVGFLQSVMRLPVALQESGFTVLKLADGANVEVFGPASDYNRHFEHPVVGFLVDDVEGGAQELVRSGIDLVSPMAREGDDAWVHFRA